MIFHPIVNPMAPGSTGQSSVLSLRSAALETSNFLQCWHMALELLIHDSENALPGGAFIVYTTGVH